MSCALCPRQHALLGRFSYSALFSTGLDTRCVAFVVCLNTSGDICIKEGFTHTSMFSSERKSSVLRSHHMGSTTRDARGVDRARGKVRWLITARLISGEGAVARGEQTRNRKSRGFSREFSRAQRPLHSACAMHSAAVRGWSTNFPFLSSCKLDCQIIPHQLLGPDAPHQLVEPDSPHQSVGPATPTAC